MISSPVIQGEDGSGAVGLGGSGFEFGIDPNEDPELALALRVSMEEQRQRQEEEARRVAAISAQSGETSGEKPADESSAAVASSSSANTEEVLLEKALAMSLESEQQNISKDQTMASSSTTLPNFAAMTEEEQIAYAMQMSLQQAHGESKSETKEAKEPEPMETDQPDEKQKGKK